MVEVGVGRQEAMGTHDYKQNKAEELDIQENKSFENLLYMPQNMEIHAYAQSLFLQGVLNPLLLSSSGTLYDVNVVMFDFVPEVS